jgi:hypothetical protein
MIRLWTLSQILRVLSKLRKMIQPRMSVTTISLKKQKQLRRKTLLQSLRSVPRL